MKTFFHKQFAEEFLDSEKLRVKFLVGFFAFGSVYSVINIANTPDTAPIELKHAMRIAMTFLLSMTAFEAITLLFIHKKIKEGHRGIPLWTQYLNAFIEISSPALIMLVVASGISSPRAVLHTPLVYLYFMFIILSTLRLDFKISIFISVLAAAEFMTLSLYFGHSQPADTFDQLQNSYVAAIAKTTVILLSGLGAAFVARQIRNEIDRSLVVAEKGSKIVSLFGQQISREIVDEMLEGDGHIPSKLMRVCVMFIDIRNFTSHVAGKTPAEIVQYQNAFFAVVIEVVTRHKGIINQFLGDGCMVTFGAPVPLAHASKNAVDAALEIKEKLSIQALQGLMPPTTIGVGIHVGQVVTGNIGTDVRQQYSITGSPVILAARLEQLNKEYKSQILASADVIDEVGYSVQPSEFLGSVLLKGWDQPIAVHKLA